MEPAGATYAPAPSFTTFTLPHTATPSFADSTPSGVSITSVPGVFSPIHFRCRYCTTSVRCASVSTEVKAISSESWRPPVRCPLLRLRSFVNESLRASVTDVTTEITWKSSSGITSFCQSTTVVPFHTLLNFACVEWPYWPPVPRWKR